MQALPAFTDEGVLPVGDFELTLTQLAESHLVSGEGVGSLAWDADWRAVLVERLGVLAGQLRRVGVDEIYVDGSFAEDKDHPNDIDGYFVCDRDQFLSGQLQQDLNLIDPHKCWTWDPQIGSVTAAIRSGSFPCGISIESSSIHTSPDSFQVSRMSSATSSSSRQPSVARDETESKEASSSLEAHHDQNRT